MNESVKTQILELTQRLVDSISEGDWETYVQLCDPSLSAFEPEARGHLVEGMDFHRFYFDLEQTGSNDSPVNTTLASPHVRIVGDNVAVVCYTRLIQSVEHHEKRTPQTSKFEETRVWERQDGTWRHVHFHRSANA